MVLESLTIQNLFCYYGSVHFSDLAPPEDGCGRNICLIVGRNNRGKTSFLNCLKLLFGGITDEVRRDAALSRLPSHRGYVRGEGEWQGLLNRRAVSEGIGPHRVSATLLASGSRVQLWREWSVHGDETLGATVDGVDVSRAEVDDWLADNAPHHALPYFLFDGELVQRLAVRPAEEAGTALRKLFGVEPLEDLAARLGEIIARWAVDAAPAERRAELAACEREVDELSLQIAKNEGDAAIRANVLSTHRQAMREVEARREELARRGAPEELAHLAGNAEALSERLKDATRDLVTREFPILPLVAAGALALDAHRVLAEHAVAGQEDRRGLGGVLDKLERSIPKAITRGTQGTTLQFSGEQVEHIQQSVRRELDTHRPAPAATLWKCDQASARLGMQQLGLAQGRSPGALLATRREAAVELARIEEQMKRFEQRTVIERHELQALDQRRLHLQAEVTRTETAIEEAQSKATQLGIRHRQAQARHAAIAAALRGAVASDQRVRRAASVRDFINSYLGASEHARLEAVSSAMRSAFSSVFSSNPDVVASIGLGDALTVQAADAEGRPIAVGSLSAGTKQLVALSLLRGLTMTTAIRLPIVVDTPIARLDEKHQTDVLSKYFPSAGLQVILLPTDSELTPARRALIDRNVYCTYELDHFPSRGTRPTRRDQ